MATLSLGLSISWTLAIIPFTLHHNTYPFSFNFASVTARNSKFPFLKTSNPSSLFVIPFIPPTFRIPNQGCRQFHWVIQGGSQWCLSPPPVRGYRWYAHWQEETGSGTPTQLPKTIWSNLTTSMDHTVGIFWNSLRPLGKKKKKKKKIYIYKYKYIYYYYYYYYF